MLKLFQSTEKTYNSNGDKVIIPLKAKVHKEDNGEFYLDLETDLSYVDDLVEGIIIVAPTPQGEQAFRITNVSKTRSKISVKAYHVFYDSKNYLIEDCEIRSEDCNYTLNYLNSHTSDVSPFTTSSDVTTTASFRCARKSLYEAINTVLDRWGGHLVRDNFNIQIRNTIGQDNGVTVRYKKNLKQITCEENWDNVVTKLLPVGKNGILLNNVNHDEPIYVESSLQYDLPYTKTVSFNQDNIDPEDYQTGFPLFDNEVYKAALVTDLGIKARKYVNENCVPRRNYTLKANVEKITDIGDPIEVIDERLGINVFTNVISYDYDCILGKYTELEFGNFQNKLSNFVKTLTSVRATNDNEIRGILGDSYVINEGDKILVLDKLPKAEATNVIRINSVGIGVSNNGVSGQFSTILGIDGTLKMPSINTMTRSLSADMTNLTANTYTVVPLDLSNSAGNKLTTTDNGGIRIGAGISKILISGNISYDTVNSTGTRYLRIIKNSNNTLASSSKTLVQGQPSNINISPVLVDVEENDIIYLYYYTPDSTDKIGGSTYGCDTSLTVEAIG